MISQHLICKHLTLRRKCPLHHHVSIKILPPFLFIEENSNVVSENLDDYEVIYIDAEILKVFHVPNCRADLPHL